MKSEWMWDRLAGRWDTPGVGLGENDIRIIEKSKKYLNPGSVVLDYGCATGSVCLEIAGNVAEVHGIDLSSRMIDIAQRKAGESQSRNVHFMHSTIFDERLREASYDLILALSVLHLVDDWPRVLNRIDRLLKPGGVFISSTPCLGQRTFFGVVTRIPLFLLSRTGMLPRLNFFSSSGLIHAVASASFEITEEETRVLHSVAEVFIAARKTVQPGEVRS